MTTPLPDRLRADLTAAMKARDRTAVSALRTTLAAIENASAVDAAASVARRGLYANEVARRELDEGQIVAIVAAHRAELREAAREFAAIGEAEEAATLTAQAAALDAYLTTAAP